MRITWVILGVTILAGIAMYFLSTFKSPPGIYDTVALENTADSVTQKVKVYIANNPSEIIFLDSIWLQPDSIPLKKILDGNKLNFVNKHYSSVTLFLTYDDRFFYDLEIEKADTTLAYEIRFTIKPVNDTFFVQGTVDRKEDDLISFSGPMIPLYKQFVLTYNHKLPPPLPDSTDTDSVEITPGPLPNKTITVLEN